jgi:hypothetical protein
MMGRSWVKHNQLFEKHNGRLEKDNEQLEKINRLLVRDKPSYGHHTVCRTPFATVQTGISNRLNSKMNRQQTKKAGV